MSNDRYLDAAQQAIARAGKRSETYAGPCSACRWSNPGTINRWCSNPVVEIASFNARAGYHAERITSCDEQRGTGSMFGEVVCGPDGALFEPRRSFLQWLFDLFSSKDEGQDA